jgi:hypothetical protein
MYVMACVVKFASRCSDVTNKANTGSFINKEGVELFQIGKDKTGSCTYDSVYIKDNNSVAVSSYLE